MPRTATPTPSVCLPRHLTLPFPENGATLKADTKLEYAGILMDAKHYDQAAALYVSNAHRRYAGNLSRMDGSGQRASSNWARTARPSPTCRRCRRPPMRLALTDPGFLSMLGAIYQQANQFEVAQGMLERSEKLQIAAGGHPSIASPVAVGGHLSPTQLSHAGLQHLPAGAVGAS
jgi:3-methyladenine DNA glycosylase/8-oxoguanine DNA glycosylase